MLRKGNFLYFRGQETERVTEDGNRLRKDRWYFEPVDWDSKYAYGPAFLTLREAIAHIEDLEKVM